MPKREFYAYSFVIMFFKIYLRLVGYHVAYHISLRFVGTAGDVKTLKKFRSESCGILTCCPSGDHTAWPIGPDGVIGERSSFGPIKQTRYT